MAFLVPPAPWIVGIPFEGRYDPAHSFFWTAVPRFYDLALVGLLIADMFL